MKKLLIAAMLMLSACGTEVECYEHTRYVMTCYPDTQVCVDFKCFYLPGYCIDIPSCTMECTDGYSGPCEG